MWKEARLHFSDREQKTLKENPRPCCCVTPFWSETIALCSQNLQARRHLIRSTWQRFTHTHKRVCRGSIWAPVQVTDMLMVLASSGWHQLMVFYVRVISLQPKRNPFLFPDGIEVEETEQNDSKQNKRNEKLQMNEKRCRNTARKLPPTLLYLQREELGRSGWACCVFTLSQWLLCSRLEKHIISASHFPEEFTIQKDKANREKWQPELSLPVPEGARL